VVVQQKFSFGERKRDLGVQVTYTSRCFKQPPLKK